MLATTLKRNWQLFLMLALSLTSLRAYAEYCWMVGCTGSVGYVYIPWSQVALEPADRVIISGGSGEAAKRYTLNVAHRLLTRSGLPLPGETVTLQERSTLLGQDALASEGVREELKKGSMLFDVEKSEANFYAYDFSVAGNPMRAGATVRIISYQGDAGFGSSRLFALVQVLSD